ncbi:hypothetical protein [Gimesia aquarii]|uniref:Uncharacterized protein n=1 Tax=Gimesia aquarii TaxID=2527964 RepID=A0A517WS08_9PLAN|nr:hypothetical protein [Gimesia aquarii]QDU08041.1 hypothetical protein V202x_14040 [Gimesia aquarii]
MSRTWLHFGISFFYLTFFWMVAESNAFVQKPEITKKAQIKQQIAQLIKKLDSNQRVVRQQSEIELISLGKPVLTLLPPPELVSSNSVRDTLQRVREQIEKRVAKDSIQASTVNLTGKHSLKKIFMKITEQTGNQLDVARLSNALLNAKMDVNFVDCPFWEAIDDLTRKRYLTYQINSSNGYLEFNQVRQNQPNPSVELTHVYYSGPFRIEIEKVLRRPLVGNTSRELLRATFLIQVEPRLRPLFLSYSSSELEAKGNKTHKLPPFNPHAKYELPLGEGGKNLKFSMQWILDRNQLPKTIEIQGRLKMELAAETLPITFDHLSRSKGALRRRGNISVELIDAKSMKHDSKQNLNVRIALSYDYSGPAFESHRTWIYHNRAFLQNSQGKKYWLNGSSQTTLESTGKISVLYQFTDLPQAETSYQFTYLAPTLITSAPIDFHFEAIPLPGKNVVDD